MKDFTSNRGQSYVLVNDLPAQVGRVRRNVSDRLRSEGRLTTPFRW